MKTTESAYTHEKGKRPNPKGLGRLMVKRKKLEERESPQNVAVAPGNLYKNILDLTPEEKEKTMKSWNEWGERSRKKVDEYSTESERRRLLDKMLNVKDEPKLTLDDLFKNKKKEQEANI